MTEALTNVRRIFQQGYAILGDRVRTQGYRTTLVWALVRGMTFLTRVPTVRYTRVTPQLYVGPQFGAWGLRKLKRLGVSAVVNMRQEFDDAQHALTLGRYCHLPTVDDEAPSLDQLHQGAAFIREVIQGGGRVYIHCAGGVGRAPTMAAAYLITKGCDLEGALALIRAARPFIRIMPPQRARLEEFQALQRGEA